MGNCMFQPIFDCFDSSVIGLAMDTNMKASLCKETLENAAKAYPSIHGAIIHSDRGMQYTSQLPGSDTEIWHTTKYEQRRWQVPR